MIADVGARRKVLITRLRRGARRPRPLMALLYSPARLLARASSATDPVSDPTKLSSAFQSLTEGVSPSVVQVFTSEGEASGIVARQRGTGSGVTKMAYSTGTSGSLGSQLTGHSERNPDRQGLLCLFEARTTARGSVEKRERKGALRRFLRCSGALFQLQVRKGALQRFQGVARCVVSARIQSHQNRSGNRRE